MEREGLGLIGLDQYQLRKQALHGLDAHLVEPEPARDYGGRDAATAVVDHVTAVFGCDLAKAARVGARVIPQAVCAPRRQQETAPASQRKRLRYPFHTQPAIATRNQAEVRES